MALKSNEVLRAVIAKTRNLFLLKSPNTDPEKPWKPGFFMIYTTIGKDPLVSWLGNIITGPWNIASAYYENRSRSGPFLSSILLYSLLLASVWIPFLSFAVSGSWALCILSYLGFVFSLTLMRQEIRVKNNIPGDPVQDFLACLLCYPTVCQQVEVLRNAPRERPREQ